MEGVCNAYVRIHRLMLNAPIMRLMYSAWEGCARSGDVSTTGKKSYSLELTLHVKHAGVFMCVVWAGCSTNKNKKERENKTK